MKKSIVIFALLIFALSLPAQRRKPAYLEIDLAGSMLGMPYDKQEGIPFVRGGMFDVGLRYSLLFDVRKGWGVSAGFGYSIFQGGVEFNRIESFPSIDDEGDPYLLYVDMKNWNEKQRTSYFTIPINIFYQHVPQLSSGWFTSMGLKAYIPLAGSYEAAGGLTTSGYYEQWGGTLMENLPAHGFSLYENFKPEGKFKPHFMLSAQFVFGGIINFDRKNEAFIAGFVEHSFINMFKNAQDVPMLRNAAQDGAGNFTGEYKSFYESSLSKKAIPLMIGIRIGWRFKDINGCNCMW